MPRNPLKHLNPLLEGSRSVTWDPNLLLLLPLKLQKQEVSALELLPQALIRRMRSRLKRPRREGSVLAPPLLLLPTKKRRLISLQRLPKQVDSALVTLVHPQQPPPEMIKARRLRLLRLADSVLVGLVQRQMVTRIRLRLRLRLRLLLVVCLEPSPVMLVKAPPPPPPLRLAVVSLVLSPALPHRLLSLHLLYQLLPLLPPQPMWRSPANPLPTFFAAKLWMI